MQKFISDHYLVLKSENVSGGHLMVVIRDGFCLMTSALLFLYINNIFCCVFFFIIFVAYSSLNEFTYIFEEHEIQHEIIKIKIKTIGT